jgi:hypothetical protein
MKADLGIWLGVDKSHTDQNLIRLPDDVRGMIVNQVRREIAIRRDLRFFQQTGQFDTADGDYDYGLPADWGRPYLMWYYDDDNDLQELDQITRSEFRAEYDPDSSNEDAPEYYSIWGSNFYLTPTPDTIYTIYYDYSELPTDLSANGDYDEFLTVGWDLILWESCKRGCGYLMETTRLPLFEKWATESLRYLSQNNSRAEHSGRRIESGHTSGENA